MTHRFDTTLLYAALLASSLTATATSHAQALNAPAARMTDGAIHADYKGYEAQQARIAALNATGRHRIASYSLSKAQCWLDVSFHEYTRNDRSAFPLEALTESAKITAFLEAGNPPESLDNPANLTPLLNGAARLREDLWTEAEAVKRLAGAHCAAALIACGEVELVHAGNEINQQGWRHAKPYVQIAEDNVGASRSAAENCPGAAPPATQVASAPPVPVAPRPVDVSVNVLFNFDKRDMPNVREMTKQKLDELIVRITSGEITVTSIALVGNADRLNGTGERDYNMQLSVDRANAVRAYMLQQGIDLHAVSVSAQADRNPVQACTEQGRTVDELEECLLPNRRVEVHVLGTRNGTSSP
jgi:OOP family OmpA-OmpF porin